MDRRFFQLSSFSGIQGLILYSLGEYRGAAQAYRHHFQFLAKTRQLSDDAAWDALLGEELQVAKAHATAALQHNPTASSPLLTLGEIALEQGALTEALDLFDRVLQQNPDEFDALLLSSVALARGRDYGMAIDDLNRALRNDHAESRITSFLKALEMTGELASRSKREKPLCLLAHYFRYLRIYDDAHGETAIAYAKQAIVSGDRPADAYLTLGVVSHKQGKRKRGLQALLKAIELNPHHAEALRWASILYAERGDLLNEYRMLKSAFESAPGDQLYASQFSYFLTEKLGDYHQALALALQTLNPSSPHAEAYWRLAYVYECLGKNQQSVEYWRKAIALEPDNYSLYEGLGADLNLVGNTDEAIAAYQAAVSMAPDDPKPHTALAALYYQHGRYREAIAAYERAFRLGEEDTRHLAVLCLLYHMTAEFQRAAACFNRVVSLDPRNALAHSMLPETLHNLRLKEAKR